jgi:predicted RNA-binding Zn ribbon-like protein
MRFEFIAGDLCLDFANTIHDLHAEDKEEELHAISDLLQWAREARLLSSADHHHLAAYYDRNPREAAAALAKGISIRDLLLSIFTRVANGSTVPAQRLSELNSALAQTPGVLRVHRSSTKMERGWMSTADGVQRVFFAVLTSAAELLASERSGRVRECGSADCTWLFVDESRNRSRRWCDMSACGNRMKARRHYERARSSA